MGFALVVRELLARRLLLALGVLAAVAAATFSAYRLEGTSLKSRGLQHSSATTQVLIDSPSSTLGNLRGGFEALNERAAVFANFMTSPMILEMIGKQVGIVGDQIYASGPLNTNLSKIVQEPTALKRNIEITGETDPYRLSYTSDPTLPTIGIESQAPTTNQAIALANAAAVALKRYVAGLQASPKVPSFDRVTIRQLGTASGSVDDPGISKALMGITFVAVFFAWCVLLLLAGRFRESWRASAELYGARELGAASAAALSTPTDQGVREGGVEAAQRSVPAHGSPPNGGGDQLESHTEQVSSVPVGSRRDGW